MISGSFFALLYVKRGHTYVALGLGQGIMPLVSYNYASKDIKRMNSAVTYAMSISLIFMTATTVLLYAGAGPLTTLFMKNEVIISYGTSAYSIGYQNYIKRRLKTLCFQTPSINLFLCL